MTTCVGGKYDGESFPLRDYPPLPRYALYMPEPLFLRPPADADMDAIVEHHWYDSVEIRWPSGATKCWLLMPAEMSDHDRRVLLHERGWTYAY